MARAANRKQKITLVAATNSTGSQCELPMLADDLTKFTVALPTEIAKEVKELLTTRGIDFSTFCRLALRSISSRVTLYSLDTVVRRGKYSGERLENIMRTDPGYIKWCADNLDGFNLTQPASDLLEKLLAGSS